VFTNPVGQPLNPDYLTRRFNTMVTKSGLPPVRLHDLRHGAATLAHAAGADLKTVQEQLGHASIVLTADTYTSVSCRCISRSPKRPPASSSPPQPITPASDTAVRPK
jgi:integrase